VRSSAVCIAWRFAPIRVEGRVVLRQFHVRSGPLCSDERKHCFHRKKHDRAKGRAATLNGARRDTAPTLKIRDERCDTFPANTLIATLPWAFY